MVSEDTCCRCCVWPPHAGHLRASAARKPLPFLSAHPASSPCTPNSLSASHIQPAPQRHIIPPPFLRSRYRRPSPRTLTTTPFCSISREKCCSLTLKRPLAFSSPRSPPPLCPELADPTVDHPKVGLSEEGKGTLLMTMSNNRRCNVASYPEPSAEVSCFRQPLHLHLLPRHSPTCVLWNISEIAIGLHKNKNKLKIPH